MRSSQAPIAPSRGLSLEVRPTPSSGPSNEYTQPISPSFRNQPSMTAITLRRIVNVILILWLALTTLLLMPAVMSPSQSNTHGPFVPAFLQSRKMMDAKNPQYLCLSQTNDEIISKAITGDLKTLEQALNCDSISRSDLSHIHLVLCQEMQRVSGLGWAMNRMMKLGMLEKAKRMVSKRMLELVEQENQ